MLNSKEKYVVEFASERAEGKAEGKAEGREEERLKNLEEKREEKREMVKIMISEGSSLEFIQKVTRLDMKTIQEIKDKESDRPGNS